MKELSIEEKAKRYDVALEVAKGLYADGAPDSLHLERMFPALKESEDEKIRKEIIYHIQYCDDTIDEVTEKRMLAWLEKQGEQKVWENVGPVTEDDKLHLIVDEQNPVWSEEDERNLKSIMKIIKEKAFADYDVDEDNNMLGIYGILESWLKSFKDRVQP